MSGKSLNDIWKQIEIDRQNRVNEDRIALQQAMEKAEQQRQAYFDQISLFESTSVSSSSAAGSGGGGSVKRVSTGESVLFLFTDLNNNDHYYFIYNFTSKTSSGILPFNISKNDYSLSNYNLVTNGGYTVTFVGDNRKIFMIDPNGSILFNKTIDFDNYISTTSIDKYSYVLYNENDLSYMTVYDGSVRTFSFPDSVDLFYDFNPYFNGGFIVRTTNPETSFYEYYLIKDGSTTPKLVYTLESGQIGMILYAYATNFAMIAYNDSNQLETLYIFNSDGDVYFTEDLTIYNIYGINNFKYLSESSSFIFNTYDGDNSYYIYYYSSESNKLTYRSFDNTYSVYYAISGERDFVSTLNEIDSSLIYIAYKDYHTVYNYYYSDEMLILPIFKGDESLRNPYTFCIIDDNRYKGIDLNNIRRYDDSIILNTNIDNSVEDPKLNILKITKTTQVYNTTNLSPIQFDRYNLANRTIINYNGDLYFIDENGILTPSLVGVTIDSTVYNKNTFVFDNGVSTYYTNEAVGNVFIELSDYFSQYENASDSTSSSSTDGYSSGVIMLYNYATNIAQVISSNFESATFSIALLEGDVSKQNINVSNSYISVNQTVNQPGIPYTHTQAGKGGPLILDDYAMDGTIASGEGYFTLGLSPSSIYFTNMYPGLFVMSVDDMNISSLNILGNLGADGGGSVNTYDYNIYGEYSKDYRIFTKRVWDAGDPSVNHIFIVPTNNSGVSHTYSSNSDTDTDIISGLLGITGIDYLVTSKQSGGYITNQEIESIVTAYLDLTDGLSLSDKLTTLNTNYSDVTSPISSDLYNFSDASSFNTFIEDGGNDMYDGGNRIVPSIDGNLVSSKISFFNLRGEEVASTTSVQIGAFDAEHSIGDRFYGTVDSHSIYLFNGTDVIIKDLNYNNIDTLMNDFLYWYD